MDEKRVRKSHRYRCAAAACEMVVRMDGGRP